MYRRQPSRRGKPRVSLPSSVSDHIWKEVDKTARRFSCSRSWVVAVALCEAMGIELAPENDYRRKPK